MYRFTSIFVLMLLIACATPGYRPPTIDQSDVWAEYWNQNAVRMEEFRKEVRVTKDQLARVADLSWPLRLIAARSCDYTQASVEFGFYHVSSRAWVGYEPYKQKVLNEEYDTLHQLPGLFVWHVIKGSPAKRAGIQVGDRITAINGRSFKDSEGFEKIIKNGLLYIWHGSYQSLAAKRHPPKVELTIKRGNDTLVLPINPTRTAKYRTLLIEDDRPHAFANGEASYITTGMLDFVKNDAELQFIIAHELVHNVEKHLESKKNNVFIGTLAGAVLDALVRKTTKTRSRFENVGAEVGYYAHSKDFEREADYIAMYILARAGIPTNNVADFWRRLSDESGDSGLYSITHPSYPERFVQVIATNKEIQEKRQKRVALYPNR